MVARPSRARAKPRSLYDEQAEELRKKGVELQTQDDDEENEEQDDDRSATFVACLLYTSPSPRDATLSRMPSSA